MNETRSATGVAVRPPNEADLPAIAELIGQLGYPVSLDEARERLVALEASEADTVFVAEADGRVAGFAVLHVANVAQMARPRGELMSLVTDERFRRRGVAQGLLDAVEARAKELGCELLVVRSGKQREASHAFYRAAGYEETHLAFNKRL